MALADTRGLCAMNGCPRKAEYLIAWPRRYPVPFCGQHWVPLRDQMTDGSLLLDANGWVEWLKANIRPTTGEVHAGAA